MNWIQEEDCIVEIEKDHGIVLSICVEYEGHFVILSKYKYFWLYLESQRYNLGKALRYVILSKGFGYNFANVIFKVNNKLDVIKAY